MPPKAGIDKGKQIMTEEESQPRRKRPQRGIVISELGNDDMRRPEPETLRGPEPEAIRTFGTERGQRDSQPGISRNEGSPTHLSFQIATAQVIVSPLLDAIFGNLWSAATQGLRLAWGADVEKELQNLKNTLTAIQAELEDAEERQFESKAIQDWLYKLEDFAYDADDLVDEIVTEAQQSKTAETGTEAGKKRKLGGVSSSLRCSWQDMACRIEEMNVRLAEIGRERRNLHLETRDGSRQLEIIQERLQLFCSVRDESPQVFGREDDREQIIKSLLFDDPGTGNFSVVAIVGMVGAGKTTLAKFVFDDYRVTESFELRAWVYASGQFDFKGLQPPHFCYKLIGKKFLLVLDNVWNEMDSDSWEELRVHLTLGAKGSKILVTTGSQAVSDVMRATRTYNLMCLSKKDCWSLFESEAFHNDNPKAYPGLLKIGVELVDKCKGLPVEAKALGGLLSSKRQAREWENILKSPMWDWQVPASEILPALRLCYQHLPGALKACFLFCSIFPKDYIFEKERLVQLWVAHGFIRPEEGKKVEDTGSDYFNDLLSRSFFQPHHEEEWFEDTIFGPHDLSDYLPPYVNMPFIKRTSYKMNGLFHNLAKFISGGECFRMEQDMSHGVLRKIRHLSDDREPINFESFYELKGLQTFLLLKIIIQRKYGTVSDGVFERLRFIRVLDLSHANITGLPNSIGNLRHLRYLNLRYNAIEKLPASICSIYNMQTLLLTGCYDLVELPNEMRKLTNLRHLDLEGCGRIVSMPPQIGGLNRLQTLPLFIVGREEGRGIAELRELTDICGKLVIKKLENVTDAEHAWQAHLTNKPLINELKLEWSEDWDWLQLLVYRFVKRLRDRRLKSSLRSEDDDDVLQNERPIRNEGFVEQVADGLVPPPALKALELWHYRGAEFPDWMKRMELVVPELQTLYLRDCRRCSSLPPLGRLPSLSSIVVQRIGARKINSPPGGYPSLKDLFLRDMPKLQDWDETEGAFPCLESLCIVECPQLKRLPYRPLANLTCLYICLCEGLVSLPRLPSLKELRLDELDQLAEWCDSRDSHFSDLQKLSIRKCPRMTRWPANLRLTELRVFECRGFDAIPQLPSLCRLELGGDGSDTLLKSMPCLDSLSCLNINFSQNLKSLPWGMVQALKQLKHLSISYCNELVKLQDADLPSTLVRLQFNSCLHLESLPRGLHALTSLHTLIIQWCPCLTSLPEEGLPAALGTLSIEGCLTLEGRCKKDAGEDWPKISHVPHVLLR